MLKITRLIDPVVEPLPLALAKQHLRVDFCEDDALIAGYIAAARDYIETWTGRALITQTWQLALNAFPFSQMNNYAYSQRRYAEDFYINKAMAIALPRAPLQDVVSITYVDGTGTPQTLDPDSYYVDNNREPGIVLPSTGVFWPYPQAFVSDTIKIVYQAGYPIAQVEETDNVPATAPYSFKLGNQNVIALDSVSYASSSDALTLVANAPAAAGQYSYANGTVTVSAEDAKAVLEVEYTAYKIPPLLTLAMQMLVAQYYENRSPLLANSKPNAVLAIEQLLSKYDTCMHDYEVAY